MARTTARKRQGRAAAGWTQLRLEEPAPAERPSPVERRMPASNGEFIAALVADLVTELGDALHTVAHQEAVAALWRRSGLPEAPFAKVLWEVRGRLKRRPAPRQGGAGPIRVAAFFVLLRDRLGLVEGTETDAKGTITTRRRIAGRSAGLERVPNLTPPTP